jgi:hypothetical protein
MPFRTTGSFLLQNEGPVMQAAGYPNPIKLNSQNINETVKYAEEIDILLLEVVSNDILHKLDVGGNTNLKTEKGLLML